MKYICKFDDEIFVERDDAWDHVIDRFTNEDFIDYTKKIGRFDEMIDGEGVSLIEWADLIPGSLPPHYTEIRIEKDLEKGFDYRKITIQEV